MKRVLVVESDEEQSRKLSEAIEARGAFSVSRAATVREAFMLIAQEPFDLAFVPGADLSSARQALHALAPDLALAVVMRGEPAQVPELETQELRGVVFTGAPDEGLEKVFGGESEASGSPAEQPPSETTTEPSAAETQVATPVAVADETIVSGAPSAVESEETGDRARRVLESTVDSEALVGGVLTLSGDILAAAGALSAEQIEAIVRRVSLTWRDESTALLQFIRPPDRASDLLLFTRRVQGQQLLTLAAKPDFNVGTLRRAAGELAHRLAGTEPQRPKDHGPVVAIEEQVADAPSAQRSFALLFRPRRPMPAAMRAAVSTALYDVAEEEGLNLHFQQVDGQLVHLVTTCPPGRGSGWLARLYKQGVEARIQDQFGVPAHMWRKGFYATESELPLSDAELKLFTEQ